MKHSGLVPAAGVLWIEAVVFKLSDIKDRPLGVREARHSGVLKAPVAPLGVPLRLVVRRVNPLEPLADELPHPRMREDVEIAVLDPFQGARGDFPGLDSGRDG